jgi:hypothetical protein
VQSPRPPDLLSPNLQEQRVGADRARGVLGKRRRA